MNDPMKKSLRNAFGLLLVSGLVASTACTWQNSGSAENLLKFLNVAQIGRAHV